MADLQVRSFFEPAPGAAVESQDPSSPDNNNIQTHPSESKSPGPRSSSEQSDFDSKEEGGSRERKRRRSLSSSVDEKDGERKQKRVRRMPRKHGPSSSPAPASSSSSSNSAGNPPRRLEQQEQQQQQPEAEEEGEMPMLNDQAMEHIRAAANRRLHALNGRPVNAGAPAAAAAGGDGDRKGDVGDGLENNPPFKSIPLIHESELDTEFDRKQALLNNGHDVNWCFLCSWTQRVSDDVQVNTDFVDRIERLGFEFYGTLRDIEWATNIQTEFNRVFRPSMPVNEHNNRKPWWTLTSILQHFTEHVHYNEVILQKQKRVYAELIKHVQRTMVLSEDEQGQKQLNPNGAKLLVSLMEKQQKLMTLKK
jgi:hypothetical protein